MIEGLQDCFPARIKGVHFIGQPWYVEAVLTLIKPFLKDKSKNKVTIFCKKNLNEISVTMIFPDMFNETVSFFLNYYALNFNVKN